MKRKINFKVLKSALCIGLCLAVILPFYSFEAKCAGIRDSIFRLHILANSDSESDQKLKITVRDALLNTAFEIFDGAADKNEAMKIARENIEEINEAAKDVVSAQGFDYEVTVKIGKSFFDTREYGSETFPAGVYDSLIVSIGEGKGHNWWCVMFPPLCVSASEKKVDTDGVLSSGEQEIVENGGKYAVGFWCVEQYQKLKKYVSSLF